MSWINSARPNAPTRASAYTHKLDFELDTAVHIFKRLPEGRWLRGLELETSLDYLATGLPKKGCISPRFAEHDTAVRQLCEAWNVYLELAYTWLRSLPSHH